MLVHLQAAVIDADPADLDEMSEFLAQLGVDVVARLPGMDALPTLLGSSTPPQLVVVKLDPSPFEMLERLTPLMQHAAGGRVGAAGTDFFVMSEVIDPQLLMDAMSAGVKEFIQLPVQPDRLRRGVDRVASARRSGAKKAKLITFVPTSGGCGATTAACNVAVTLAKKGRTALIDLDLSAGSVAESLDLRPRFSIADVTGGRLDRHLIDNALVYHKPSGLAVLARPEAPEDATKVTADSMQRLLSTMADGFDYLVVDSQLSMEPVYATAVKASDEVVLVVQLTVPSIRNTSRYLNSLRRQGLAVGDQKTSGVVRVVANRFTKRAGEVKPEAAEKALGMKIDWTIPNDYANAIAATNYGDPVVLRSPRAEMSTSLDGLAHLLNGRMPDPETTPTTPTTPATPATPAKAAKAASKPAAGNASPA